MRGPYPLKRPRGIHRFRWVLSFLTVSHPGWPQGHPGFLFGFSECVVNRREVCHIPQDLHSVPAVNHIVLCDSAGDAILIDGASGERLDSTDIEWLVEASPAVFNDKVVVGTRGQKIYGLTVY